MKDSKGQSQPEIAAAAFLFLYMVLGRPFQHRVLIVTHVGLKGIQRKPTGPFPLSPRGTPPPAERFFGGELRGGPKGQQRRGPGAVRMAFEWMFGVWGLLQNDFVFFRVEFGGDEI